MSFNKDVLKIVCRCGYCTKEWRTCEFVPVCPHNDQIEKDISFSISAHDAMTDMFAGKFRVKIDAARAHDLNKTEFYLYRKACGYIEKGKADE